MVRLEFAITLRYKIGGPSDFIFNVHAAETAAQRIVAERIASNVPIAPMARVEAISRWVRQRIRFATGTTTSATTALDTLTDQRGVCRDFAHLMIALCRALNIPARFVTGVDYGADPALGPTDFHAYIEAYLGDRWYLFDPTDISPTTGLLRIGTGRDAADVSFATLFGDVRCEMPEVSILSVIDPARGLVAPARTRLAVSTTEAVAQRPTLQLIRRA